MRIVLNGFLFAAALILPAAAAEDRPDDLVKAAIVASGGEEILAKFPAGRVVGKGVLSLAGTETAITFEQAYHVPGRFRTLIRCDVKGQKWEMIQVVSDGVAKQAINGRPIPISDTSAKELQSAAILNEIAQLSPLIADRKFTLKHDKQLKAADATGILVQVRGHPEIRLAFDQKSGHLVRIAYKVIDPESAKEVELETIYDEFKTVSGLTRPTRSSVTRDGKRLVEFEIEQFTPLEQVDPKAFTLDG